MTLYSLANLSASSLLLYPLSNGIFRLLNKDKVFKAKIWAWWCSVIGCPIHQN